MNPSPDLDLALIHRLYGDFLTRTNLVPNLLIVGPRTDLAGARQVLGMTVLVDDLARVDYRVAYVLQTL